MTAESIREVQSADARSDTEDGMVIGSHFIKTNPRAGGMSHHFFKSLEERDLFLAAQALALPRLPSLPTSAFCYGVMVLPAFTLDGDLPVGVHMASWQEFQERFGAATSRRVWLSSRLEALLGLAAKTGKLRRIFVWGSFVTAKPSPKDIDILLIMDEDFEVERIELPAQTVFNSLRAKLLFESDVFWTRASIGKEVLELWLETYQTSRDFRKRGIVELELL